MVRSPVSGGGGLRAVAERGLCFEPDGRGSPMPSPRPTPGAYKALQTIAPGAKWVESFWVRPSGF